MWFGTLVHFGQISRLSNRLRKKADLFVRAEELNPLQNRVRRRYLTKAG